VPDKPKRPAPAQKAALGGEGSDLPAAAARLREGLPPQTTDVAWPADYPYGPMPKYENDEGLFTPEEQAKPLSELAGAGGDTKEAEAGPDEPEGGKADPSEAEREGE
jgi:hypothetical protein